MRILNLPSIAYRRSRGDMIEVYKILHDAYTTNKDILKVKTAITRGPALKLEKHRFNNNVRKMAFSVRVASPWNSLPDNVTAAPSLNAFKNRLDHHWRGFMYSMEPPAIPGYYAV